MSARELRILTVRQPWAWAIVHGGKDVENRVTNVAGAYRGPIAIHAGLEDDGPGYFDGRIQELGERGPMPPLVWGAIIGVVDLVDVHEGAGITGCHCRPGRRPGPECSPWAERDAHHLSLENPRPLASPIPYRGALGLRHLPDEVAAAVWAEVAS